MGIDKDNVLGSGIGGNKILVGGTRSMRDVIDKMVNSGRSAIMMFGDSTVRWASHGWAAGIVNAIAGWAPQAGFVFPINASLAENQNGGGIINTRRRDNFSSKLGISQSLPSTYNGLYIQHASGWLGPEPALLGQSTLSANLNAGVTSLTLTDATEFPNSGRVRINNEIIQYTGKSTNTLTGLTRGQFSSGDSNHVAGDTVVLVSHSITNTSWNIDSLSGMNKMGNICQILFYTPYNSAYANSSFTLQYKTIDNYEQTATTTAQGVTGSSIPLVGASPDLGGNYAIRTHGARTSGSSNNMVSGSILWTSGAFVGVTGPGMIRSIAFLDKDRPTGFVNTFPISQGGKRLNDMLSEEFASTNNRNGLAQYLWDYWKLNLQETGGNNSVRLTVFNCWGHNESGVNGCSGFVDPTYPWTIMKQTTLTNSITAGSTSIVLDDITGLNTTAQAGGHILIGTERIRYANLDAGTKTISGLTRGFAGTTAASHTAGAAVYQGYPVWHPDGLATDLLFFYNILKTAWLSNPMIGIEAGELKESDIDFIYVRPSCMSDDPVVVDDMAGQTSRHEREYKLQRYARGISDRLASIIPGYVLFDPSSDTTYAERMDNNWTDSESDDIHDNYNGYYIQACRTLNRHMRGGGKRAVSI